MQFAVTCIDAGAKALDTRASLRAQCLDEVALVVCVFSLVDRTSWDELPRLISALAEGVRICCIATQ